MIAVVAPFVPSICGVPLKGSRLVRLTYCDDCGLFNVKQEPYIVVAGFLLDADRQLVSVEEHLERLSFKCFPAGIPANFYFHAKDLYHGSGFFPRDHWSLDDRMSILLELAETPRLFELPVMSAHVRRDLIPRYEFPPNMTDKEREVRAYVNTFARFCEQVEEFMVRRASNEITTIIAEDRDSVKNRLKAAHNAYRDPQAMRRRDPSLMYFPFQHIREGLQFSAKSESKVLQIADTCAFVIKRHLIGDKRINAHFNALAAQLSRGPTSLKEPRA